MDSAASAAPGIEAFNTEGMSPAAMVGQGNLILSALTDTEEGYKKWPRIAVGYYDSLLLHAFFHAQHHRCPVGGEEVSDEHAQRGLKNAKQYLRDIFEASNDPAGFLAKRFEADNPLMERCKNGWREVVADQRRAASAKKKQDKATREAFVSQHAAAPEGTIAELAAKHGKSKAEIRRLKAAGLLHTLGQP